MIGGFPEKLIISNIDIYTIKIKKKVWLQIPKNKLLQKYIIIILSIFKKVIINKYKNLKTSYEEPSRLSILT